VARRWLSRRSAQRRRAERCPKAKGEGKWKPAHCSRHCPSGQISRRDCARNRSAAELAFLPRGPLQQQGELLGPAEGPEDNRKFYPLPRGAWLKPCRFMSNDCALMQGLRIVSHGAFRDRFD